MIWQEWAHRHSGVIDRHSPNVVVNPIEHVARTIELDFRWPIAKIEAELLLDGESLGINFIERRSLVTIRRTRVATIGDGPHLIVLVEYERSRLYAYGEFGDYLVGFGIDFENSILVGPAVDIDIFAILHHLLGRARLHGHIRTLDITCYLVAFWIDDKDAVIPNLSDIRLFVVDEVHIARRSEVGDAPNLLEGVDVDSKYHMRIVDYHPTNAVTNNH